MSTDFGKKLQQLRREKGITQQELAEKLYVSRTAVSKWESGRGMPGLDSLQAVAEFFSVTVDQLLSDENEIRDKKSGAKLRERYLWAALDCGWVLFFLVPLFGQRMGDAFENTLLLTLAGVQPYVKAMYILLCAAVAVLGAAGMILKKAPALWQRNLSVILCGAGAVLFAATRQPYAASAAVLFLAAKVWVLLRR